MQDAALCVAWLMKSVISDMKSLISKEKINDFKLVKISDVSQVVGPHNPLMRSKKNQA